MGAEDGIRGAGKSHQPVSAHEGDELSERGHNTQQSPQHGAAGDNDMAHADGGWSLPLSLEGRRLESQISTLGRGEKVECGSEALKRQRAEVSILLRRR